MVDVIIWNVTTFFSEFSSTILRQLDPRVAVKYLCYYNFLQILNNFKIRKTWILQIWNLLWSTFQNLTSMWNVFQNARFVSENSHRPDIYRKWPSTSGAFREIPSTSGYRPRSRKFREMHLRSRVISYKNLRTESSFPRLYCVLKVSHTLEKMKEKLENQQNRRNYLNISSISGCS